MSVRVRRFIFFLLAIVVGIAAGTGYGWAISPRQTRDTGPHTLREDYKADYVLMTAELYQSEGDVAMAIARLSFLGDQSPTRVLDTAINYANSVQYDARDLQLMNNLKLAVESLSLSE